MRGLFDAESPLMNGLGKIFDCIMLSVCWLVASLPIVTMGAACGALYRTVYRSLRQDDGAPFKMFWQTWTKNLKHSIFVWLPVLAMFAFLIADAIILRGMMTQENAMPRLYGIIVVLIAVCFVWAAYCTSYCVRFEGTVKEVLWLSIYLTLAHPLTTIIVIAFLAAGIALALIVPFLAIFAPAAVCLAISFPMEAVYRKHMRPEDIERVQNGE